MLEQLAIFFRIFLLVCLCACNSEQQASRKTSTSVPVITTIAQRQTIPLYLETVGTLIPSTIVEIRPQVSGFLKGIHFREGSAVSKGDLLFTIDKKMYEIKQQELEAQLIQDQAMYQVAKKKLERFKSLSREDLIPRQEWDEQEALVNKMEGVLKADHAKLQAISLEIQNCNMCSPIEGKTGKLLIHPGNYISAPQSHPLLTITQVHPLVVEFSLTEGEYLNLKEKNLKTIPFEVVSLLTPEKGAKGELFFIASNIDPKSGLLHVKGIIDNEKEELLPGQSVRVRMLTQTLDHTLLLPQKAIKINQHGPYVYIIDHEKAAQLRQVKLGREIADQVVILEGIEAGDAIVTEGHLRLAPGVKVEMHSS